METNLRDRFEDAPRRAVVAPLAAATLCLCVAACGGGTGSARSVRASAAVASQSLTGDYDRDDEYGVGPAGDGDDDDIAARRDGDNDTDNRGSGYYDGDDREVRGFGHAADAADRAAIARLVRRYFAIAAGEDGAAACTLIVRSLGRAVPGDYGRPPAPPYSRGRTCAAVMTKIFAYFHHQLAAHAATLRVAAVRVRGREGMVVLAFGSLPGRELNVAREQGTWRVAALLDTELP